MPLSPNGLCDADSTTPRSKSMRARQIGHARRRQDAGAGDRRAGSRRAARELARDPFAGFARVAPENDARGAPPCVRTIAAPRRATVGGSSGHTPATPRTPSVPNSRAAMRSDSDQLMVTVTVAGRSEATVSVPTGSRRTGTS